MYGLNTINGSSKSMHERPETAIAKAGVISLDCTALWFLTEIYREFRRKNSPIDDFAGCFNEALFTVYKIKNVT